MQSNKQETAASGSHTIPISRNHRSRRSRHRHRSRSRHRLRVTITLLSLLVIVLIVAVLLLSVYIASLNATNNNLSNDLIASGQTIRQLQAELEKADREMMVLTEGRLPNLLPLEPDTVIEIAERYLKNIVFTEIKSRNKHTYEYKLVMENTYNYPVITDFRLLIFDKRGIQIGTNHMRSEQELLVGESRSYSGSVNVIIDDQPRYFSFDFRTGK